MAEEQSRSQHGGLDDEKDHESDQSHNQDHDMADNDPEKNAAGEESKPYDWPPNDPEHPHNWNTPLKLYIGLLLTLITMVVSINSSIYGTASAQTMPYFHISHEVNTLGTSLFLVVSLNKRRTVDATRTNTQFIGLHGWSARVGTLLGKLRATSTDYLRLSSVRNLHHHGCAG